MKVGYEDEQLKSVIFLSSDDEEEARKDLSNEILEKSTISETERKNEVDFGESENRSFGSALVIDLYSSDEVEFVADRRIRVETVASVAEVKKKKKRSKKKKKKIEEDSDVDVVRAEESLETVTTVDTEAVGILENGGNIDNHLVTVEAMDMETTGMLENFVEVEEALERIETTDKVPIGTSENGVLRKNEEDFGKFKNESFQSVVVIDLLSSVEVEFIADQRRSGEAVAAAVEVEVMRAEEPSETVTAVGILEKENATNSENLLTTVEAMDMETTGMLGNFVKAEEPLERIETTDNIAIGTSENGVLRKNEEDFGKFKNESFQSAVFIDLSSSDEVEFITDQRRSGEAVAAAVEVKKKKRLNKTKKTTEEERVVDVVRTEEPSETVTTVNTEAFGILKNATRAENHLVTVEAMDMEASGPSDSFVKEAMDMEAREPLEKIGSTEDTVEISDNAMLRKLLRVPRYFDPSESHWNTCYYCGKEGHIAANCTSKKQKKPCFVCGKFGHDGQHCTQGHHCYICRKRGHMAKDCSKKQLIGSQSSKMCLRCGDVGHDMSLCINDYAPEDLKRIQCYICKSFGHLCCVNIIDTGPREFSCYNCGQSGHTGSGCAKPRGERNKEALPILCYKCGEEGHLARGCTKSTMTQIFIAAEVRTGSGLDRHAYIVLIPEKLYDP